MPSKDDVKSFALGLYRTALGILVTASVWLANEVWGDITNIQKSLVEKVQALEVRVEKFMPSDNIVAMHESIRREVASHDARLKGVETSQEYQMRSHAQMAESLNRLERALGTK